MGTGRAPWACQEAAWLDATLFDVQQVIWGSLRPLASLSAEIQAAVDYEMNWNEKACVHTYGLPHIQLPASVDAACLTASIILTASRAAEALCALMMLAPFCKQRAAATAVAQSLSAAISCPAVKGGVSQPGNQQHLLIAETVRLTSELAQKPFARGASQQGLLGHSPSETTLDLLEASHEAQIALHAFGKSNACRDTQTDCTLSQQQ